jgi:hypothetical protein
MIPSSGVLNTQIVTVNIPTNTYKVILDKARISGYTDGLAAMRQAVYLILSTERYAFPIYSWNYGIELRDLFGQQTTYVIPELKRRITEALMQDDRITNVSDFQFEVIKNKVSTTFTVTTTKGEIEAGLEVSI